MTFYDIFSGISIIHKFSNDFLWYIFRDFNALRMNLAVSTCDIFSSIPLTHKSCYEFCDIFSSIPLTHKSCYEFCDKLIYFQGFPLHMNLAMTSSQQMEQNTIKLIKDQNRQLTKVGNQVIKFLNKFSLNHD